MIASLTFIHFSDRLFDLFRSVFILNSISRKINEDAITPPVFRDYEDYLGEEVGGLIDVGRIIPEVPISPVKSYLFQYSATKNGAYLGTFTLPISPGVSLIFTSYSPENLNPARLNVLLHEIGHADEDSWHRSRNYSGAQLATLIILFVSCQNLMLFILSLVDWICSFGYTRLLISEARFHEELRADSIGVLQLLNCIGTQARTERARMVRSMAKEYWARRRKSLPKDRTLTALQIIERARVFASFNNEMAKNYTIFMHQAIKSVRKRRFYWSIPVFLFIIFILIFAKAVPSYSVTPFLTNIGVILGGAVVSAVLCILALFWVAHKLQKFGEVFLSFEERNMKIRTFYENAADRIRKEPDGIDLSEIIALHESTQPIYEMVSHFQDFGFRLRQLSAETFALNQILASAPQEKLDELRKKFEGQKFQETSEEFRRGRLGRKKK